MTNSRRIWISESREIFCLDIGEGVIDGYYEADCDQYQIKVPIRGIISNTEDTYEVGFFATINHLRKRDVNQTLTFCGCLHPNQKSELKYLYMKDSSGVTSVLNKGIIELHPKNDSLMCSSPVNYPMDYNDFIDFAVKNNQALIDT